MPSTVVYHRSLVGTSRTRSWTWEKPVIGEARAHPRTRAPPSRVTHRRPTRLKESVPSTEGPPRAPNLPPTFLLAVVACSPPRSSRSAGAAVARRDDPRRPGTPSATSPAEGDRARPSGRGAGCLPPRHRRARRGRGGPPDERGAGRRLTHAPRGRRRQLVGRPRGPAGHPGAAGTRLQARCVYPARRARPGPLRARVVHGHRRGRRAPSPTPADPERSTAASSRSPTTTASPPAARARSRAWPPSCAWSAPTTAAAASASGRACGVGGHQRAQGGSGLGLGQRTPAAPGPGPGAALL